jgi:hypothetical protein
MEALASSIHSLDFLEYLNLRSHRYCKPGTGFVSLAFWLLTSLNVAAETVLAVLAYASYLRVCII